MPKENRTIGEYGIFATRLRGLMDKHNITHQELADKLGVSRQAVSWYYFGKRQPNFEKLIEISEFFDVSTDYLLGVSEFKNYNEIKKINENTDLFREIENPHVLENMKDISNTLAEIGKSAEGQIYTVSHCLDAVVDCIHEMLSYSPSIADEELKSLPLKMRESFNNMKLLEFKAFSAEKIETASESIKTIANELANKIKGTLDDNDYNGEDVE